MPAAALNRSDADPLWAQLESDLRRRIDAGEFDDGLFPGDMELTESYGVSRHTVREAIKHLNKTGLLKRERGRGTVINRAEFEQSLGTLYSLFQSVESAGVEQTSEVLELRVDVNPEAAGHLGLEEDTELVLLARLRLAAEIPLAVDRAWLPTSIGLPLLDVDWSHTALYDELQKSGCGAPKQGWERLTPVVPSAADRKLLGLKKSDAVFSLERLGICEGQPIEWRTTLIRGDRYRFVTDWSAGTRPELRHSADG